MGGGGYDFYISAFTGNALYTYITFGTVFSIRKNVRKWIESQMERLFKCFVLK